MHGWQAHTAARLAGEPSTYDNPWPGLPESATVQGTELEELDRLWQRTLEDVKQTHALLVSRVAALDPAERYPSTEVTDQPHWMVAVFTQLHDSYHSGQIALLRGLQGLASAE
ncbi:MAG: hypothetical protein ACI89L_002176 [Phycisphaerales bacterium]|jgi:hypothetical protein